MTFQWKCPPKRSLPFSVGLSPFVWESSPQRTALSPHKSTYLPICTHTRRISISGLDRKLHSCYVFLHFINCSFVSLHRPLFVLTVSHISSLLFPLHAPDLRSFSRFDQLFSLSQSSGHSGLWLSTLLCHRNTHTHTHLMKCRCLACEPETDRRRNQPNPIFERAASMQTLPRSFNRQVCLKRGSDIDELKTDMEEEGCFQNGSG